MEDLNKYEMKVSNATTISDEYIALELLKIYMNQENLRTLTSDMISTKYKNILKEIKNG